MSVYKVGAKVRVMNSNSSMFGREGIIQAVSRNRIYNILFARTGYADFGELEIALVPKEKKVDPYAELKLAYTNGKTIQYDSTGYGDWRDMTHPSWSEPPEAYRVKPEEESDPYAELKKAYREGKKIEVFSEKWNTWIGVDHPRWSNPPEDYRVKPEGGGMKVGHLDVIAAKAGVGKSFVMNVTKKQPKPKKEMKMKFETKHYLNGQDITNLENIEIYREIAREESALKALGEVQNKPKRLQKEIAQREAELKAFVEFLDAQDKGS